MIAAVSIGTTRLLLTFHKQRNRNGNGNAGNYQ